MNCERVRELVLTDYSDGQLPVAQARKVENHLMTCLDCRMLAEKVRKDLVALFNQATPVQPDEFVWRRIKTKIEQKQAAAVVGVRVSPLDIVGNFIYSFRPAVVTLCLFLVVGAVFFVRHQAFKQEPYLMYMMGADNPAADDVSSGIEQYFL